MLDYKIYFFFYSVIILLSDWFKGYDGFKLGDFI